MNCLATILFALFLLSPLFAHSQTNNTNITWSDIVDGTQNWINDNLDTNLLNALPEFDEDAVREFFAKIQGRFSGEYVIDLAGFKQTAQFVLPILQSRDELKPYARWLSVQIDYLEVADEIKVLSIPPPNADTNAPPREELVVESLTASFFTDHLIAAAGGEDPIVELGTPYPERILEILMECGAITIE